LATIRGWRAYVSSIRSLGVQSAVLPPALEWWCSNYALIRNLAIRGYPAHVVSYDSFLRDPARVATEVLAWIGQGDPARAREIVRSPARRPDVERTDSELADGISPRHLEVFDELYDTIDRGRPLSGSLIAQLNRTDEELRPEVIERHASVDANTLADILGRR
jgi:hypothetical protein